MTLSDAVQRDLDGLPRDLGNSAIAATALAMAEAIETGRGSRSECGKVLLQALEQLRALAPPKREKDGLDDLASKRAARRSKLASGGATAKDSPSP